MQSTGKLKLAVVSAVVSSVAILTNRSIVMGVELGVAVAMVSSSIVVTCTQDTSRKVNNIQLFGGSVQRSLVTLGPC